MNERRLSSLRIGSRFSIPSLGLSGVLCSLTPCGATVEYDDAPSRRLTIYRDVAVIPLED